MIERIKRLGKKRLIAIAAAILLLVILALNHLAYASSKENVLPNTKINNTLVSGNISQIKQLETKDIQLTFNDETKTINLKSLKISTNAEEITKEIYESRTYATSILIPFSNHSYQLELDATPEELKEEIDKLFMISLAPTDPALSFEDGVAQVKQGVAGRETDIEKLIKELEVNIITEKPITIPVVPIEPNSDPALNTKAQAVNAKLERNVTIKSSKDNYVATKADKVSWVAFDGQTFSFDPAKVLTTLRQVQAAKRSRWSNINTAATQIAKDLGDNKDSTVTMTDAPPAAAKTITYCVQLKNVSASELAGFKSKVAQVLADNRGWSLGGKVKFVAVDSGCQFTAWLSAPNDVAAFSPSICDSYYSCRVGNNVIINYDRWVGATNPWNAAGGGLSDYRNMVINHEVGHWLGFGHSNCPGGGQPAPVMQQQSISLQGCKFNPWPTQTELVSLAKKYGL